MDDTLILRALGAILADDALRGRFLALTGYDVPTLRARLGEPDLAEAVRGFLAGHEPDLIAIARKLDVPPATLLAGAA